MAAEPDEAAFQVMLELASNLMPMKEAVNGHRAWAKDSGYSDRTADQMALCLHNLLLAMIFRQATGG